MTKEKNQKNSTSQPLSDRLTLPSKGDLSHILSSNGAQASKMHGFRAEHVDIIDYIIKITHEIWEERGIGRLYEYYATDILLHTNSGTIHGRETVIENTIQALASYPDRRLFGEECIWTGNDKDGYLSSHRLRHEGTNWGHTPYGPPTNNRVSYRAVADCKVVEGVIVEEWLTRDNLVQIAQLGFDVHALARELAAAETGLGVSFTVPTEGDRLRGQMPPDAAGGDSAEFDIEQFTRTALHQIWNWRLLNKINDYYAPNYICKSASGRNLYGRNQLTNYVLQLMSPFPDLAFSIDHFCALQDDENTYRTATRWIIQGTHKGIGIYGKPSGNKIHLMGMTHQIVRNGQFVQEYTVFDEFELLKQIYAGSPIT